MYLLFIKKTRQSVHIVGRQRDRHTWNKSMKLLVYNKFDILFLLIDWQTFTYNKTCLFTEFYVWMCVNIWMMFNLKFYSKVKYITFCQSWSTLVWYVWGNVSHPSREISDLIFSRKGIYFRQNICGWNSTQKCIWEKLIFLVQPWFKDVILILYMMNTWKSTPSLVFSGKLKSRLN